MSLAALLSLLVWGIPAFAALCVLRLRGTPVVPQVGPAVGAGFFWFHACAALLYPWLAHGAFFLAATLALSTLASVATLSAWRSETSAMPSARLLLFCAGLALAAICTDAWISSLQGFSFETRLSRFAAPYAGDHWRHTAILGGLLRGDEGVFLPGSQLVYQILWHHGAAALLGVLPEVPTLFHYELGVTLATGFLLNASLLWLLLVLRPELGSRPWILAFVALLLGTDADLFNAALSWLSTGSFAIAADSSSLVPSAFRYFSAELVSLTAPQHAAFFICASFALPGLLRGEQSLKTAFTLVPALVFSPILSGLFLPLVYMARLLGARRDRPQLVFLLSSAAGAVIGAVLVHTWVLRFPPWDPFLRPNLTGGGSGEYGLAFLPWLGEPLAWAIQLPLSLVAMTGLTGALLTLGLVWAIVRRRQILRDPLVIAVLSGTLLWNLVVVDTEIQRHWSMILGVFGALLIGVHLPLPSPGTSRRGVLALAACALLALSLNALLIRAYTRHFSSLPLTSSWPDYFCANQLIASDYPDWPVVVRTPVHFELPISAEATSSLVWSQISAVHQRMSPEVATRLDRINPRDWRSFRAYGEADPEALLATLQELGYEGVIWGPLEREQYGPLLAEHLARPERFLASCGTVALYALGASRYAPEPGAAERHAELQARIEQQADPLLSVVPGTDVRRARPSDAPMPAGENLAPRGRVSQSSQRSGRGPRNAVDGDARPDPRRAAFSRNERSPWWQLDLGARHELSAIRISTLVEPEVPDWQLKRFYVLVSDEPLLSPHLFVAGTQPGVTSYYVPGRWRGSQWIPIARSGRYVRIQATLPRLILSEVEVMGPIDARAR